MSIGVEKVSSQKCEELEDRLAALHQVSIELVQDITLESLLKRITEIAREQVSAKYAAVSVLNENGELEHFIPIGLTDIGIEGLDNLPGGEGLMDEFLMSNEIIHYPNISANLKNAGFIKNYPDIRSLLTVPIQQGNRHLGQILLANKYDGDEFTIDDEKVIQTLASYAGIAISNAINYNRLVERERIITRRNENLALLNELTPILASSLEIDQIIDNAVKRLMDYLGLEAAEIFLRVEDSRTLTRSYHSSYKVDSIWKRNQFLLGEDMIGITAETGKPGLINLPSRDTHNLNPAILNNGFSQVACFPLKGQLDWLGVLCVATSSPKPFGELEMQFLNAICTWMGTAIENARLHTQQKRLAVLEERERIGMDLHDGIIQSIYAVGLTLEHVRLLIDEKSEKPVERIDQVINDLNNVIRDLRAYILDLRPRQLHDESLMDGAKRLVTEFRANTLVDVDLNGPEDGLKGMPKAQALALFHICQEALANAAKHAHAKHVDVNFWTTSDRVLLEVTDDGDGFELDIVKHTIGHGLSNMQTRAQNVGGDVDISSEAGLGSTVLAWVPFSYDN